MIKHVLTKEQAERLNQPELAGETVLVDALRNDEPDFPTDIGRIAKNVFYNEQRITINFSLDEQ